MKKTFVAPQVSIMKMQGEAILATSVGGGLEKTNDSATNWGSVFGGNGNND